MWGIAIFITLAAALVVTEPYVPGEVSFGSSDDLARKQYEKIVAAHGYAYRHDTDIHGEVRIIIDRISAHDYKKIDCDYFAWRAKRDREQGVIVYDRPDCAL